MLVFFHKKKSFNTVVEAALEAAFEATETFDNDWFILLGTNYKKEIILCVFTVLDTAFDMMENGLAIDKGVDGSAPFSGSCTLSTGVSSDSNKASFLMLKLISMFRKPKKVVD